MSTLVYRAFSEPISDQLNEVNMCGGFPSHSATMSSVKDKLNYMFSFFSIYILLSEIS